MGDMESPDRSESRAAQVFSLLMSKELIGSRKGQLLLAEVISSFISFVCFCASTAAAFVTAPLLAFISALLILFAHAIKFNQRFKGFHWPLMNFLRCITASIVFFIISIMAVSKYPDGSSKAAGDFLRCITASIVFFIISIMAVSKYPDGSSKAAGVFGFVATIVFALDFYFIFNELADFLKGGGSNEEPQNKQDADSDSDSD